MEPNFYRLIAEITKQTLIDCRVHSAYDLNNGNCDYWAETVYNSLRKTNYRVEIWGTIYDFADTSHIFVRINELFYDAECSLGVKDHMDLPIFKKILDCGGNRQPVQIEEHNYKGIPKEIYRDVFDNSANVS